MLRRALRCALCCCMPVFQTAMEANRQPLETKAVVQIHTRARSSCSEVLRVVRELQSADIPLAVLLLTGTEVRKTLARGVSCSGELSSHQQLIQVGLATQDFTAVSSVCYAGALLQPELLEATVSALGATAAASNTVVMCNIPLNLAGFHEAGTPPEMCVCCRIFHLCAHLCQICDSEHATTRCAQLHACVCVVIAIARWLALSMDSPLTT